MTLKRYLEPLAILAAGALLSMFILYQGAHADITNPHPTPPANSITSVMLTANSVTPPAVDQTQAYNWASSTAYIWNTGVFSATTSAKLPATVTINNQALTFPSNTGSANQSLTTNGSGTLSWATPAASVVTASVVAKSAVSAGDPVEATSTMIAIDAISTTDTSAGASTQTEAHTTATNATVLLVCMMTNFNTGVVSVPTYNGVAMTLEASTTQSGYMVNLWALSNPASGTHNISYTFGGTPGRLSTVSTTYSGVNTTSSFDATSTQQNASATALTDSLTTVAANDWAYRCFGDNNAGGVAGANSTLLSAESAQGFTVYDNRTVAPLAANVTATMGASGNLGVVLSAMMAFKPIAGTPIVDASANMTSSSAGFMGLIETTLAAGAAGTVDVAGVSTASTSISTGSQYYLANATGTMSTSAGAVSHKACVGVAKGSCLITNIW